MSDEKQLVFIEETLRSAGDLVLGAFGERVTSSKKQDRGQIVTAVDLASEERIIQHIAKKYPESSILAEESGYVLRNPEDVWVIDPIDGTSNFANGIPWFGIMVAHVVRGESVASGIFLPVSNEIYVAEKEKGAYKNGKRMRVFMQKSLSEVLIAYGTDGSERSYSYAAKGRLYEALIPKVLNLRCTNSAVDYAYAAEGKLGGLINLENRIWDIAPVIPIATEAGCLVSDIEGGILDLRIDKGTATKNFTLLLSSEPLYAELLRISKPVFAETG